MYLKSMSCVFPAEDIAATGEYYETMLGFRQVRYLSAAEPHICLYRDGVEVILTQAARKIVPNRELYGYGYDAYFYTADQEELYCEFVSRGVKIVRPLNVTDYSNHEFVVEDLDGRWLGFGIKCK